MDSSNEKAAQVAHILHGARQAEEGEQGCDECGSVLCNLCRITNSAFDCYLCDQCHVRYEQDHYERQREDAASEESCGEHNRPTSQIRWAIGALFLWQLYTL